MDLLAFNHLGQAMHASLFYRDPAGPPNFARYTFPRRRLAPLLPRLGRRAADTCVAILHTEAGRDPHDKVLHDLVGELSTRSQEFRRRWSARNVRYHGAGTKHFHHQVAGQLELGLRKRRHDLRTRPHPHHLRRRTRIPPAHALTILASWAATQNLETPARNAERTI